jgi:mannose-1-phosphate guanylyltransferase/mannose-6-phosphate isomerase
MSKKKIIPLILSGGSGSRLWPLSRKSFPKQFLPLFDEKTLFHQTLNRINQFDDLSLEDAIVISNIDYRELVNTELQSIDASNVKTLYEPFARNTAAAVTVSCLQLQDLYVDEAYILVMPSDHLIENELSFQDSITEGINLVDNETIIFFGIKPLKPHTGYGYIKHTNKGKYPEVEKFTEKPSIDEAKQYLEDKNYLWNAGIFLVNANHFISLVERVDAKFLQACKLSLELARKAEGETYLNEEAFSKLESISVDYMIMEKIDSLKFSSKVIEINAGWDDMGSWDSVFDKLPKDELGNYISDGVSNHNSKNNLIISAFKKIVVAGVRDLLVIDTPDALLISAKEQSEYMKEILDTLSSNDQKLIDDHAKVIRPWGSFETISEGENYKIKRLTVNPGHKLSKQKHEFRSEAWTLISGEGIVTLDEEEILLKEGQSIVIPVGSIHRLENNNKTLLELIEVQTGTYFGEDDITRYDDIYGRS